MFVCVCTALECVIIFKTPLILFSMAKPKNCYIVFEKREDAWSQTFLHAVTVMEQTPEILTDL